MAKDPDMISTLPAESFMPFATTQSITMTFPCYLDLSFNFQIISQISIRLYSIQEIVGQTQTITIKMLKY
jgi:hypothetical protein